MHRPPDSAIDVVLVDGEGNATGTAPKLAAHEQGLLHRAISVFVFNSGNEVLLQRRASGKYHSGGRWTNTACSHPVPGERPIDAARRSLAEEMGLDCELHHAFAFTYRAEVGPGLVEHEYDDVFTGTCDDDPVPTESEVEAWRWCAPADVDADIAAHPERFTAWFPLAWKRLRAGQRATG